jgi:DNA-binding CsgD family transcriptional regulator
VVCHASCLRDESGELGNTALVIEPAAPAEIAPIVTQAYELTLREREITQLIAGGHGTRAIAGRLHLSTHTVRVYVKTIFDKVGVSSREELVAKLFADHYAPLHLDPDGVDRVQDRLADRPGRQRIPVALALRQSPCKQVPPISVRRPTRCARACRRR